MDDLFCCLYSSAPGLPPALIAYKKKSGPGPLSYTLPWEGMFLLCMLPKIKILCNVRPFFCLCELWCCSIVFPIDVRWACIKNVSCFLQKKICMQNISHVYFSDIMNIKQILSHIMFVYQTPCGRIDDWSILLLRKIWPTIGVLSKKLIFCIGFYVGECPLFLKKLLLA
jgi:hypothetical protein